MVPSGYSFIGDLSTPLPRRSSQGYTDSCHTAAPNNHKQRRSRATECLLHEGPGSRIKATLFEPIMAGSQGRVSANEVAAPARACCRAIGAHPRPGLEQRDALLLIYI